MKNNLLKIFLVFLVMNIVGCSFFSYADYIKTNYLNEWKQGHKYYTNRSTDFTQESYIFENDSIIVEITPNSSRLYLITCGPAYLPIIPFFPLNILVPKNNFEIKMKVSKKIKDTFIRLKDINILEVSHDSCNYKIFERVIIDNERVKEIKWIEISDKKTIDDTILLKETPFVVRFTFSKSQSQIEKVLVKINGIFINNNPMNLPVLELNRDWQFHFDNLKFGV